MKQEEKHELIKILEGQPFQIRPLLRSFLEKVEVVEEQTTEAHARTSQQNKALWKFFQLIADELTKQGVSMRTIFEKTSTFDIPPSKDNVHDLWVYFQKALYGTEHTRDLKKTDGQIDKIHEVMMKNLGEMFHIDYIDFPHDEKRQEEEMKGYKTARSNTPYPEYKGPPSI